MVEKTNCPNCGAPITGATCEYCGTLFYDFANVEIGKETYFRMKIGDTLNIFKAIATNVKIEAEANETTLYADDNPLCIESNPEYLVSLQFCIVADDRGVIFERRKKQGA